MWNTGGARWHWHSHASVCICCWPEIHDPALSYITRMLFADQKRKPVPGSVTYQRESNTLAVCCKVCSTLSKLLSTHNDTNLSLSTPPTQNVLLYVILILIISGDMCSLFQDGWVGFKAVLLKKRMTAADFYNGYLHQTVQQKTLCPTAQGLFVSRKGGTAAQPMRENSVSWCLFGDVYTADTTSPNGIYCREVVTLVCFKTSASIVHLLF